MTKLITYEKMIELYSSSKNPYTQFELTGRKILYNLLKEKQINIIKFVDLNDKYAIFDGYYEINGIKYIFELKNRPKLDSTNKEWWIDVSKIDKLKELKNIHTEFNFLIIVTTSDNKLLEWDINNHNPEIITQLVQKTQTTKNKIEKKLYIYDLKNKI